MYFQPAGFANRNPAPKLLQFWLEEPTREEQTREEHILARLRKTVRSKHTSPNYIQDELSFSQWERFQQRRRQLSSQSRSCLFSCVIDLGDCVLPHTQGLTRYLWFFFFPWVLALLLRSCRNSHSDSIPSLQQAYHSTNNNYTTKHFIPIYDDLFPRTLRCVFWPPLLLCLYGFQNLNNKNLKQNVWKGQEAFGWGRLAFFE
mgnify:CR=1 FL=1